MKTHFARVLPGDTISKIAHRYGVDTETIAALNQKKGVYYNGNSWDFIPGNLVIGEKIIAPGDPRSAQLGDAWDDFTDWFSGEEGGGSGGAGGAGGSGGGNESGSGSQNQAPPEKYPQTCDGDYSKVRFEKGGECMFHAVGQPCQALDTQRGYYEGSFGKKGECLFYRYATEKRSMQGICPEKTSPWLSPDPNKGWFCLEVCDDNEVYDSSDHTCVCAKGFSRDKKTQQCVKSSEEKKPPPTEKKPPTTEQPPEKKPPATEQPPEKTPPATSKSSGSDTWKYLSGAGVLGALAIWLGTRKKEKRSS